MEMNQDMGITQRLSMPMCQRVVNSDISEDFTLPDYYPEIRRVLYVREDIPTPARFISGNKIDVNGVVDYTLVYVNSDGGVCSAPLSAEYSFALPIENVGDFELGEGVTVMAHTYADSSNVRVSAPRKLQIRSHLRSAVSAYGKMLCEDNFSGLQSEGSIERLYGESVCGDIVCESSDVITLEDEYQLPSEECGVALADGGVYIEDSRIEGEMIRIRGEAVIRILVSCANQVRETVTRRLPFEAETDIDGIAAEGDALVRVSGTLTDLALNVEDGRVMTEANVVLEVCVGQNKPIRYTKDIYSVEQESEAQMRLYRMPVVLENRNLNFTQSDKIELSELNFPQGAEIVHTYGNAVFDQAEVEGGKCVLSGSCKYDLICLTEGEYSHVEVKLPFKHELDMDSDIESFDATAHIMSCKVRNDGEFLNFDSEIFAACTLMGRNDTEIVEQVSFGEGREESANRWIVYYVTPEDDIWNIAKRYGVREADIKGDPSADRYVTIER